MQDVIRFRSASRGTKTVPGEPMILSLAVEQSTMNPEHLQKLETLKKGEILIVRIVKEQKNLDGLFLDAEDEEDDGIDKVNVPDENPTPKNDGVKLCWYCSLTVSDEPFISKSGKIFCNEGCYRAFIGERKPEEETPHADLIISGFARRPASSGKNAREYPWHILSGSDKPLCGANVGKRWEKLPDGAVANGLEICAECARIRDEFNDMPEIITNIEEGDIEPEAIPESVSTETITAEEAEEQTYAEEPEL